MNTTAPERLLAGFSPASDADWRAAAEESLEGASFEKKLVTRTPEAPPARAFPAGPTPAYPARPACTVEPRGVTTVPPREPAAAAPMGPEA